jgi:hypothetical protein
MEELKNLLKYTLYTAYLEKEKPVSILIIAKTESGKTENIQGLRELKGVLYLNDTTPYGLVKEIYKIQEAQGKINHIIIPDLLNPLARSQSSVEGFIHFMNSAIEEGITKIETAYIQYRIPLIQCGLITAITREAFNKRVAHWKDIGFLRRMLPFTYKYPINMASEILESIFKEEYLEIDRQRIDFPKECVSIKLNEEFARKMYPYTARLATVEDVYGFTFQKHFQRLLKAVALSKGKDTVDKSDVKDLQQCAEYMNLDFNYMK